MYVCMYVYVSQSVSQSVILINKCVCIFQSIEINVCSCLSVCIILYIFMCVCLSICLLTKKSLGESRWWCLFVTHDSRLNFELDTFFPLFTTHF